jgi:hypothetical protein
MNAALPLDDGRELFSLESRRQAKSQVRSVYP